MKTYLLAILFVLVSLFISAQDSIPLFQKKSNLKLSILSLGANTTSSVFVGQAAFRRFSIELEKFIEKRQTFTLTPTYSYYRNRNTNSLSSRYTSNYFELGLGYNYYILQQNKTNPFKGIYLGSSLFGGQVSSQETRNGNVLATSKSQLLGLGLRLGTQTSLFKSLTLSFELIYRADRYFINNFSLTTRYLNSTLRLGYSF